LSKPGRKPNSSSIFKLNNTRGYIFAPEWSLVPVCNHPAIELLNGGYLDKQRLTLIHLEYRHAIGLNQGENQTHQVYLNLIIPVDTSSPQSGV
jgi:hypothetical protein